MRDCRVLCPLWANWVSVPVRPRPGACGGRLAGQRSFLLGVRDTGSDQDRDSPPERVTRVAETLQLAADIRALGIEVTGFYPNIMTVLAGTELERSLRARGIRIDFYRMPHAAVFEGSRMGEWGSTSSRLAVTAQPGLAQRLAEVGP